MIVTLAGRAAECVIFGDDKISSGAEADIDQATYMAGLYIKRWGMKKGTIGTWITQNKHDGHYLGNFDLVDQNTQDLVLSSLDKAISLMSKNKKFLKGLAIKCLEVEKILPEEFKAIASDFGVEVEAIETKDEICEPYYNILQEKLN